MQWIVYAVFGFIILEGITLFLFPVATKKMMEEASPRALVIMGLVESLVGTALLYAYVMSR